MLVLQEEHEANQPLCENTDGKICSSLEQSYLRLIFHLQDIACLETCLVSVREQDILAIFSACSVLLLNMLILVPVRHNVAVSSAVSETGDGFGVCKEVAQNTPRPEAPANRRGLGV